MTREGSMARGSQADQGSLRGDHASLRGEGARSKTPPGTPLKMGGKMLAVRVQMLDDSVTSFQVQAKASGKVLFDQVCKQLNLLETDYFGLEYMDTQGVTFWLDRDKPMSLQVSLPQPDPLLRFVVKFYMPDPSQLEEEYTRYLAALQVKRDLATGQLHCNDNTAALMASYIVQAECGDYVGEDYPDHTYLSSYKFVPGQSAELERRIMENHKKHTGQSPAEADLNLLETARRCELYGIKMHAAKDHEGVSLSLAVANMGVLVFQQLTKINTFSWAKIRKLSFKRKKFLIKLHPEGYGYYKDIVEFYFDERNHCKNFWKKCVEHHGFFRCIETPVRNREKPRIISRGSSFRYSGRTQKQMQEHVRENFVKRQSFQRHVRSLHGSVGNVGLSVSAQPLLPLADNHVVGTAVSLSCGSMNFFPDDHRSVYSAGRTVSRLRDFDDFMMDSPYSGRRPSSHTATYLPAAQTSASPDLSGGGGIMYRDHHHLPNFHHDHLHHQEHDQLGINTLQPNTQRRERAREALLRRNQCDFNTSQESSGAATTNSVSSTTTRTGTAEVRTEMTVVAVSGSNNMSLSCTGGGRRLSGDRRPSTAGTRSNPSLHSVKSDDEDEDEEQQLLSSEDNLSHESYDLLDKEEEAQINTTTFSETMKTVLSRSEMSFDNSASYAGLPVMSSMPHTPNKIGTEDNSFFPDNLNNSNNNNNNNMAKHMLNSASSTHSSHLSINSSGLSGSPLPDSGAHPIIQEPTVPARRRSSGGSGSQKSKSSRGSKSGGSRSGSHVSLMKESPVAGATAFHLTDVEAEDSANCETFHESLRIEAGGGHPTVSILSSPGGGRPLVMSAGRGGSGIAQQQEPARKVRDDSRDSGMHENIIFQSPTNLRYFASHIIQPPTYSSRTLPSKKASSRRHGSHSGERSPVVYTSASRGRLSVDCSSNSSSSQASPPRPISRPKSLDFSVVAMQNLPRPTAYSYRDDTIDQPDYFEDSSSALSVQNCSGGGGSSSDVPPTPEFPPGSASSGKNFPGKSASSRLQQSSRGALTPSSAKGSRLEEERIYDIPEGIEHGGELRADGRAIVPPRFYMDQAKFKSYLEISGKFSSEESESGSHHHKHQQHHHHHHHHHQRHKYKVPALPPARVLKKVSSTESESAPASYNSSLPPAAAAALQFDSDTLSLPLDLLSPPMESESSALGMVDESESLPAPPQFMSNNKDDTDIEDESTPRGEDLTPDSLDTCGSGSGTIKKKDVSKPTNLSAPSAVAPEEQSSEPPQPNWPTRKEPARQESTYEARAEAILESQTTIDSFAGDTLPPVLEEDDDQPAPLPEVDEASHLYHQQLINDRRRGSVLLRALDTFDSFNQDHEFPVTCRRQESTYEERAEAMLEKQLTVDSFTSQLSIDNDNVFFDHPYESIDSALGRSRETILESQSTFESFTTECEVFVTKRQESTYEERAEHLLESQNTIDSFTNEVPNDELDDSQLDTEEYAVETEKIVSTLERATTTTGGEEMIADMYVRQLAAAGSNDESFSTNGDSENDSVPFIDDGSENEHGHNNCTGKTADGSFYMQNKLQNNEHCPVYISPISTAPCKIGSGNGFCFQSANYVDEDEEEEDEHVELDAPTPINDLAHVCLEFCGESSLDTNFDLIDPPPPPIPPEEFGAYSLMQPPPSASFVRDGFHGSLQRTLSRISEKSSNEESAGSPHSDVTPAKEIVGAVAAASFDNNTSMSDHEEEEEPNYTTSEDNENAPSISSDLPENMAMPLMGGISSFEDVHQYGFTADFSPPSSPQAVDGEDESAGRMIITEYTHIEPDTLLDGEEDDEDPDETNADEIRTEEEGQCEFLQPVAATMADISANSNSNEPDEVGDGQRRNSDEGSLHDSMEILEDVSAADHFDQDQDEHCASTSARLTGSRHEDGAKQRMLLLLPPPTVKRASAGGQSPTRDTSESSGRYVVKEGTEELMF